MTACPNGIELVAYDALNSSHQQLLRAAREALELAYNPYSRFFVGASVLTNAGEIVTGSNVENAAYGPSICAERCALMRANAQGLGDQLVAIAVVARRGDFPTTSATAPCGTCRQVIFEFASRSHVEEEFRIILASTNFEKVIVTTIGKLLPLAFGPKDLTESV
jgi:cytidine deaminase